jgi:hypothetical protein
MVANFFSWRDNPLVGLGLHIHEGCFSRSHTATQQSAGLLWTSDQLVGETSDNTQHSQQTDTHALGGIRTDDLSRRAAVDLRLRPRDQCSRLYGGMCVSYIYVIKMLIED